MDSLTPAERSKNMRAIKGKNTRPELLVRSMLHRASYRFHVRRSLDVGGSLLRTTF